MTDTYHKLQGLGTALITPFRNDGTLDEDALIRLINRQTEGGADYLVVLGTTGEAATMSREEKMRVIEIVTEHVHGRLPLVLGMGGNNTALLTNELKENSELIRKHFTAILSVCPYYHKPSQEGLFQHFKAVAEVSPVPVILYNVPGRTGVNMLPETVIRIWEDMQDKIAGIKEASGNIEQIKSLINMAAESYKRRGQYGTPLLVISGDDGITAELMDAGADGLISVAANAFPEVFKKIVHMHDHALQQKYEEIVRLLFAEGNPSGIKTVLALQGQIDNNLRLPLVPNSETIQQKIKTELKRLTKG